MSYSTRSLFWFLAISAVMLSAVEVADRCWVRHTKHSALWQQMTIQIGDLQDRVVDLESQTEELTKKHVGDLAVTQQLQLQVRAIQDQVGHLLLTPQPPESKR